MAKKRSKIPQDMADRVLYESELRCCVCGDRGRHIHHLDGDPSNTDFGNLVLLCFECHNEASVTGGMGRKLSAGAISRFREHHYLRIRHRRRSDEGMSRSPEDDRLYDLAHEAVCVREVERLAYRLGGEDWEAEYPLLLELQSFSEEMGPRLRRTILYVLDGLASQTRMKMPIPYGEAISSITHRTLSLWTLRISEENSLLEDWFELRQMGCEIGQGLAYDAALYTGVFRIVDAGGTLLWRILALAVINNLDRLRAIALEHFDAALDGAKRGGDRDALDLLQIYRHHGLAGESQYPDYSDRLVVRLTAARRDEWTVS